MTTRYVVMEWRGEGAIEDPFDPVMSMDQWQVCDTFGSQSDADEDAARRRERPPADRKRFLYGVMEVTDDREGGEIHR